MPVITVRVPEDEHSSLVQQARIERVSLSVLVRRALGMLASAEDTEGRLEDHEKRIGRLEGMAGLS